MKGIDIGPTYLRNKIAQLLVKIGSITYPLGWPDLFQSMLGWLNRAPNGPVIDLFLRVSLALGEQLTLRAPIIGEAEHVRNNAFKDAMRLRDIAQMVQAWVQLLQMSVGSGEASLSNTRMLLQILAVYTEWIDVALVASPQLLSLVYGQLENRSSRCEAVQCLTAIVAKGMPAVEKFKLISYLNLVSVFEGTTTNDPDWYSAICRLLAAAGVSLAEGIRSSMNLEILTFIEDHLLPNAIRILWAASAESVIVLCPFFISYFDLLKTHFAKDGLNEKQTGLLASLLEPVIRKARLPDDHHNVDGGDFEDEESFAESRHQLEPVYDHIVNLASHRATTILHSFVMGTLGESSGGVLGSFADLEVALYLLFRYSEAMKGHPVFQITINRVTELTPFGQMISSVIDSTSRLPCHPHPAVVQHYFEIVTRYAGSGYFEKFPLSLPSVVKSFFQDGLRSPHQSIRIKCAGLLYKLVKSGKDKFISPAMVDRLVDDICRLVSHWLGEERIANVSFDEVESRHHILEALGLLETCPRESVTEGIEPITIIVGRTIDSIGNPQDPLGFARLSFALKSIASVAKGVVEGRAAALSTGSLLTTRLQFPQHIERLQRYLSAPYAPILVFATQRFLSIPDCNLAILLDFLVSFGASGQADRGFMVDLLAMLAAAAFRLKQNLCPVLAKSWLPLQQRLLQSWNSPAEGTDDQVRQSEMRHKYSALLLAMFAASNMISDMFARTGNLQACFELAFMSLFNSVEAAGAIGGSPQQQSTVIDGPLLRTTYSIVVKMLKFAVNTHQDLRMAVLEYVQRTFLPASLSLPLQIAFSLQEGPSQSVITEFCQLHRTLLEIHGSSVYGQIMQQVFASMPAFCLDTNTVGEFVAAVASIADLKEMRSYYTVRSKDL